jgi:hypothetical protein
LYIFWDTVSPDGKYALAWSTTGSATPDDLPPPVLTDDNPVSNYVIEVPSHKTVLRLPDVHYWKLYGDGGFRPNHYSLETVWSDDSRWLLAIYDSRWSSDIVLLIDASVPRAASIAGQLKAAFDGRLKSAYGREYSKRKDGYEMTFASPWFVAPGRFSISAGAEVPKHDDPDYEYTLYFQTENGGTKVKLVKAGPPSFGLESSDRSLNRTYRTLHGLLSSSEQKALVEEERAWLVKRDAIRSETERKAFIDARTEELEDRTSKIIEEKEKQ